MTDIESKLRNHFNERTRGLPDAGPGPDVLSPIPNSNSSTSGRRSIALLAASALVIVAVGALVLLGNRSSDSVSGPDPSNTTDGASRDGETPALQPIETLPSTPDVSETPATVAAAEPIDWYRFAPDLDIAWYLDPQAQSDISMFCWRTTAVVEPQCYVDPLGATIVPLVVPVAGGQTVVLAGGDPANPTLTVTLDDGTTLESPQDFDEIIDWGAARFELPPERVITSVEGVVVDPPQTIPTTSRRSCLASSALDLLTSKSRPQHSDSPPESSRRTGKV